MAELYTHDERTDFARAALNIMDGWGLEPDQQIALLGMPTDTKPRELVRFRNGSAPLPDERELLVRVRCLLSIQHSLESAFPHNPILANYWVTTANQYFNDHTPLSVMLRDGVEGMEWIARYLDGSEQWG